MMKTLILICAVGTSQADCSIDTAADVIQGPNSGSFAQCGFLGQAYLAETAMAGRLDDHYLKVVCTSGERLDVRRAPDSQPAVARADNPQGGLPIAAAPSVDANKPAIYRVGIGTSPR